MRVEEKDIIRAYDFKPMHGREDSYIEGEVIARNAIDEMGFNCYKVLCTKEVFSGETLQPADRRSETIFVPWKIASDWQGRIINLSR